MISHIALQMAMETKLSLVGRKIFLTLCNFFVNFTNFIIIISLDDPMISYRHSHYRTTS